MNLRVPRHGLRRAAALTLAGVLLATVSATVNSPAPAAAAGAEDRPTLLEASLPDGLAAASVQAFAVPPSTDTEVVGESRAWQPVATDLVGDRPFAVVLDPTQVPEEFRYAHGVVDFSLFLRDQHGTSWTTFLSARAGAVPATDPGAGYEHVWVLAHETEHDVTPLTAPSGYPVLVPDAGPVPAGATMAASSATTADYDDEAADVNPSEFARVELPANMTGSAGNNCLRETYEGDVNRPTTIGTSYPIGTTTSGFVHSNSSTNSSSLGVAVGYEGENGGFTWKQGGEKRAGGSWSGTWALEGAKRSYRIDTNYHKYTLGKGCHGEVRYRRPHIEIGGGGTNYQGLTRPGWNTYCAPQPLNYTFKRDDTDGKAYTYEAAVKFASAIGIDLSIAKQYSQNNLVSYKFSGDVKHQLCGKDEYPSKSSKLIDRFL